jgi:hypothetical protein
VAAAVAGLLLPLALAGAAVEAVDLEPRQDFLLQPGLLIPLRLALAVQDRWELEMGPKVLIRYFQP